MVEQPMPGFACRLWKFTKHRDQFRLVDLQGMVKNIAAEERLFGSRTQRDNSVIDAVTGGTMEGDTVKELSALDPDQLGLLLLNNGRDAVRIDPRQWGADW